MTSRSLHIGFTLQNSGMDLNGSTAAPLQLRNILQEIRRADHYLTFMALRPKREILLTNDLSTQRAGELGISDLPPFKAVESAIRRTQSIGILPFVGIFDSYRFYEACTKNLANCEVLHERYTLFSVGTALASKRMGLPYVLSLDADEVLELDIAGRPMRGIRRLAARQMCRLACHLADAITCVTHFAKDHFVNQWGIPDDKISVIHNGVDIDRFRPSVATDRLRAAMGFDNNVLPIVFVGGFYPWHGLTLLVDSFRSVLRQVPEARLVLVGDGEIRAEISEKVERYGMKRKVVFAGTVDHSEVPAYLHLADVCVAPYPEFKNKFWQSPLKIFEYMAAGKAIVASGIGHDLHGLIDRENCILVLPGDSDELAKAILELLNNPSERKRLGANARRQAVREHSWQQYVSRLEEVYASVI